MGSKVREAGRSGILAWRRAALLSGTIFASVVVCAMGASAPAFAAGGAGGTSLFAPGGAGGTGPADGGDAGVGGSGTDNAGSGGGGGGGGAGGGAGGTGGNGGGGGGSTGVAGGLGGATPGAAGADGTSNAGTGAPGGGGGGAHGITELFAGSIAITGPQTGGNGGNGGAGTAFTGGGGGGEGGYGAYLNVPVVTNNGTLQGGAGGAGGNSYRGGSGGNGGIGFYSAGTATIVNNGTIAGGDGGAAGTGAGAPGGPGSQGVGGRGLVGQNLTISTQGAINGGLGFNGRAAAIHLLGGTNTITLKDGFSFLGVIRIDGGSLTFNQADDQTLGTVIVGAGSIGKSGAATLALTAANTYSGGTTVNAGVLQIENAGALGTGAVTLAGGTLRGNVTGTVGNRLVFAAGNSASVTAADGQTLTLTGTYDIVGNVRFGSATDRGTIIAELNGGTIAGSSQIEVNGGTVRASLPGLTAVTSSAARTTVAAGATLDLNDWSTAGLGIQSLHGAGTVVIGTSAATQLEIESGLFSGRITGAGALKVVVDLPAPGGVLLVLTGANDYSGGTIIQSGQLQLGDGGTTGSILGNVNMVGGGLRFQRSDDYTFAGVLSGAGAVTQGGSGTTILTAVNTYTGPTQVLAGKLVVNGSIASSSGVSVGNGATLGGSGVLPATVINNGGALAPGNSIGTITVQGNLRFQPGSIYSVEVDPGAADRTDATGTATLTGGTVRTVFAPGSYAVRQYTILSAAGGLGGTTFGGGVTGAPAGFKTTLSYTSTDVLLSLEAQLGDPQDPGGTGGQNGTSGLNANQRNVAQAINTFFNNGGALPPDFVTLFGLTGESLRNGLAQLSGQPGATAAQAAFQSMGAFLYLMSNPLVPGRNGDTGGGPLGYAAERSPDAAMASAMVNKAAAGFGERWSVWGSAYGGDARIDADPVVGTSRTSVRAYGAAAGLDYRLSPDTVVGFALAGGSTSWSLDGGLGGGRSDLFQAGLYGTHRFGAAYVSAALAYAAHWAHTDRTVTVAGTSTLVADFKPHVFAGRLEGGYRVILPWAVLTPYAAMQAQSFSAPAYAERATAGSNAFALGYAAQSVGNTRSELGLWADRRYALQSGADLTLRARAAWAHDFDTARRATATFQTLPGATFVVNAAAPSADLALLTAAAELRLAGGWSLAGRFDGEFGQSSQSYAGTATARYRW